MDASRGIPHIGILSEASAGSRSVRNRYCSASAESVTMEN